VHPARYFEFVVPATIAGRVRRVTVVGEWERIAPMRDPPPRAPRQNEKRASMATVWSESR
jgi:hypothetical protein